MAGDVNMTEDTEECPVIELDTDGMAQEDEEGPHCSGTQTFIRHRHPISFISFLGASCFGKLFHLVL